MGREGHCKQYHWCVGGVLAVYGPHWVCPSSRWCALPGSTLLRLQGALQGHCPKRALYFVHFPSLSDSGFWVPQKGTDSVGPVFCTLPRSKQLRQPGAWWAHCSRRAMHHNYLPGPSHSFSQVCHESTISGVLCVSSGELISDCNPPGRCQLFRIPGRCG